MLLSSKPTKLDPTSNVLLVNWKRGAVPVPSSFPDSATKRKLQQVLMLEMVLKVLSVALSSGPARLTVLAVAPDWRTVRKFPAVFKVPLSKVTSGSVPLLLSVELFPTKRKDIRFKLGSPVVILVLVALKSGPPSVKVGGVAEVAKPRKFPAVVTVLRPTALPVS